MQAAVHLLDEMVYFWKRTGLTLGIRFKGLENTRIFINSEELAVGAQRANLGSL